MRKEKASLQTFVEQMEHKNNEKVVNRRSTSRHVTADAQYQRPLKGWKDERFIQSMFHLFSIWFRWYTESSRLEILYMPWTIFVWTKTYIVYILCQIMIFFVKSFHLIIYIKRKKKQALSVLYFVSYIFTFYWIK